MQVYKISNNKIIEIKNVLSDYTLSEFEYFGNPPSEIGNVFIDGNWVKDPQEELEAQKQLRISELKEIITNKKLLDIDCTAEQNELRGLLGL